MTPYEPRHPLRSAKGDFLVGLRALLVTKGDLAFAVQVPKLCNDLPAQIRSAKSITAFKPFF